jgi:hypothetical protein
MEDALRSKGNIFGSQKGLALSIIWQTLIGRLLGGSGSRELKTLQIGRNELYLRLRLRRGLL